MKQFKEAFKLLKNSDEFKEWKGKNPETYLSYAMYVVEDEDDNWKIGYYHKEHNKVISFDVGEKIKVEPEDKVLKEKNKTVGKIDAGKVKHDLSDAVTTAVNLQKEEYATEAPKKIIAILQTLEGEQVWNITFFTQSFNTLNFKIRSESLRVIDKKLQPLFKMDQKGMAKLAEKLQK